MDSSLTQQLTTNKASVVNHPEAPHDFDVDHWVQAIVEHDGLDATRVVMEGSNPETLEDMLCRHYSCKCELGADHGVAQYELQVSVMHRPRCYNQMVVVGI